MRKRCLWVYLFILLFWTISLSNLTRFPVIHQDEPWILSPGYKLWAQGIYGSDFFTGFYGMEQHYMQFMPLMSILEGAIVRIAGIGIFQLRFVTVNLGVLILALTYHVARQLAAPRVGLLAVGLLLTWQWTNSGGRALGTGIPLVDLARIARYDLLAATFGFGALASYLQARRSRRDGLLVLTGLFAGLAGLGHIYGLFWVALLSLLLWLNGRRDAVRRSLALFAGVMLVWLPWLFVVAMNWSDYLEQVYIIRSRYDVLGANFYLANLLAEPQRYAQDWSRVATYTRTGFWLLIAGMPLAWLYALRDSLRRAAGNVAPLLILSAGLALLLALLISPKTFNYLIILVPVWSLLLAWSLERLLASRRVVLRLAALVLLTLTAVQGARSIIQMQIRASRIEPAEQFLAELQRVIPTTAVVLGHPQYALPFMQGEYRSFLLPFLFADPDATRTPISMQAALTRIAPRYIIYDPAIQAVYTDQSTALTKEWSEQFHAFLQSHHAQVMRQLTDQEGNEIQVLQLQW